MRSLAWGLLASIGVLWPSRLVGPLDGAPLDAHAEAVLAGIVLPLAWILHPRFFAAFTPRILVASLVTWKLGTWLLLTQQGVCATFGVTSQPDHLVLRRSWDFRTAAPEGLPQCSAVITRPIDERSRFPAWFLNLPVGKDHDLDNQAPKTVNFPATAQVTMNVDAFIASSAGVRRIESTRELHGDAWQFDLPYRAGWLSDETATIGPPSPHDVALRHLWFIAPLLTLALVGYWIVLAFLRLRMPRHVTAALVAMTIVAVVLGWAGGPYPRAAGLIFAAALLVKVPFRLQGTRAVVLFVGIPLLAMLTTWAWSQIGRFTLYSAGDDWQTFQRYAARIYFEGFWLEGGERTFWQQPLYRWLAGFLHVIFGDSSVGEVYWDGFGLVASAMLAYVLVRPYASHRWAFAAAVATVATTLLAPTWYLVGRGLSEITATMWLALAAAALLRAHTAPVPNALVAGIFATLAVYTRLNHVILAFALVVLLLPRGRAPLRAALTFWSLIAVGLALFAARTWYYTGHFSVLYGTTREFNATELGLDSLTDLTVWRRVIDSVLMVVTVSDPPRFDPRSILVIAGVIIAVFRLLHAPFVRAVPLGPAVVCLAAIASAFVARGLAYPGRFSLHLIPLAIAVSVLLAARAGGLIAVVGAPRR